MSTDIEMQLIKLIAKHIEDKPGGINPSNINSNSSFTKDLQLDSLDMVEVVMLIETEFDIEVSDSEAAKMQTISDAVEYIKNKKLNTQ